MKLSNLTKPVLAASLLAILSMGCAAQTEDADDGARTGTTQEPITGPEVVSIASGTFGIVNGAFTAYVTLDNLITYGAPGVNDKILGGLATANAALESLQTSQAEQFRQLQIDAVMGSLNLTELDIGDAWNEYNDSTNKAGFVPSKLTWSDFNNLDAKLSSIDGTTDAFSLIKDGMLKKTGGIADDPACWLGVIGDFTVSRNATCARRVRMRSA